MAVDEYQLDYILEEFSGMPRITTKSTWSRSSKADCWIILFI